MKHKRIKKHLLGLAVATATLATAQEQDKPLVSLTLQARADYQRVYNDGQMQDRDTGFKGQFLNLIVEGDIDQRFSYSYRQRLNKITETSFFEATDWLFLNYKPVEQLTLSGGKQVVVIGGYEYDRAPIDLYYCSEFWNAVPCYAWGASVAIDLNDKKDNLLFQFCQSPFAQQMRCNDTYAYNLQWAGRHGIWSTLWSVNMVEWDKGRFINYIALGNELNFSKKFRLQFDWMNRASSGQRFLFSDYSVMAELAWKPSDKLALFAKATYDVNRSGTDHDLLVTDGSELTSVGAGVEYYPLRKRMDVRLHANCSYAWGKNTNPDGIMQDRQTFINMGVTWSMNVLNWRK